MNPHLRSHLAVLSAFTIAALAVTWPLVLNLNRGVPYGGDAFQFIWNGWWFGKAARDPALSVWFTPYQYAPEGASLALHDLSPLNACLQALMRRFTGDFAAYNILVLFHYVLGAWGAYILAWYLTGNRAGSVIAGVIYGFSTHHAMHLSQLSTVSSGWLPLGIYYLLKYVHAGGTRDGFLAVLVLLASALSSWYHIVFAGVVFFGFMVTGQFSLRDRVGGFGKWVRALTPWLVSGVMLSPLILAALEEASRQPVAWRLQMGRQYFLDLAWLILPSPGHPVFGGLVKPLLNTVPGNVTEGVASIGIVSALLGIPAWFRKDATTRSWCLLGLLLLLLALGPSVSVLGTATGIPGPFRLWEMLPGVNLVRIPARFVGPFTLALAMSCAGFVAGLPPEWRKGFRRFFLLCVIPVLILFETLAAPVPVTGSELNHPALARIGEIYQEATGDPNPPDLVVNFPVLPERAQFLYQQTVHQIPTVDGALSNPPAGARDFLMRFNWNPEFLGSLGVDLVLYQRWAARTSLGEVFRLPASEEIPPAYRGASVPPETFFREVMRYRIIYEDENLILFVP